MKPSSIPVAILDVNGIAKIIMNAGNASSSESELIFFTALIIVRQIIQNEITNIPYNICFRVKCNSFKRKIFLLVKFTFNLYNRRTKNGEDEEHATNITIHKNIT